jgi:hypothetical protein
MALLTAPLTLAAGRRIRIAAVRRAAEAPA